MTTLLRVEKGHASEEEVAALTALVLARAAARPRPPDEDGAIPTRWRAHPYHAPHSWRD